MDGIRLSESPTAALLQARYERNRQLAAALEADGIESRRQGLCSGHGIYTTAMPWMPQWGEGSARD